MVLLAPLPFGSATTGWATWLRLSTFVLLALTLLLSDIDWTLQRARAALLALLAVTAIGLLQAVEWPRAAIEIISPEHLLLFDRAAKTLAGRSELPTPSLSLNASDSIAAAVIWLWAAAALVTAYLVGRRRVHRRLLATALLTAATFQVVFGLYNWLREATSIWSVEVPTVSNRLRGTFVNPDHMALFLEICLALCCAWSWWSFGRGRWAERSDRSLITHGLPLLVAVALVTALALTGSRAGLLAAGTGFACQATLLTIKQRKWRVLPLAAIAATVSIGLAGVLAPGRAFVRWFQPTAYGIGDLPRRYIYESTWELWQRFPIVGTGLGTYREAFPLVQPVEAAAGTWGHAHNAALELLATAGVVGLVVIALAFVFTCRQLFAVFAAGRRSEDRAAALAALGALAAVGFHEMFDFGVTIPANGLALATIVGAALACPTHRDAGRSIN